MSNVIEFNLLDEPRGDVHCWLCQRGMSERALFCHHCGTIQQVRDIDHFTRLGVDKRIDLASETLERQYATLKRALDPERFAIRGIGERGHAAKQLEALVEAYETLRDPVRRGRYWISLNQQENTEADGSTPMITELRKDLESAAEVFQCDRVAHRAGLALEQGIKGLMQALRTQQWQIANAVLMQLDGLEMILSNVRNRRDQLAVPVDGSEETPRLK
jgi:molecular chaperone HscB